MDAIVVGISDEHAVLNLILAKATSAIVRPNEGWQPKTFFYGYLWYQTNLIAGDKSYDVNIAWGGGKNLGSMVTQEE